MRHGWGRGGVDLPAYLGGQFTSPSLGLCGAVLGAHVAGGEDAATELLGVCRDVVLVPDHLTRITDHLCIYTQNKQIINEID